MADAFALYQLRSECVTVMEHYMEAVWVSSSSSNVKTVHCIHVMHYFVYAVDQVICNATEYK